MFALFAGNTDEHTEGGIENLVAVRDTRDAATARLDTLLESDSGIDWAHVADLDQLGLPIVAEWDGRNWHLLAPGRLSVHIDLDETDEDEDDELERLIEDLASLDGMDPGTTHVLVLAEHRRACDGPDVFGPFGTARLAREYVIGQYRSGEFDTDGCTVEYKTSSL